ncbi:MAG: cytochrome c [Acidobacteriota bacterium]|nr:cytochrome c [Acidobacteriota bacterium]
MQPLLLKSLAILLFLFIGLIYAFPGELQTAAHGVKTQRSGAAIYASSCTSCHGADGSGNTRRGKRKGAKDLRKSRISTARGISIITNGKGKMPAFESTLSAQEISRVNTFVRGLRTN